MLGEGCGLDSGENFFQTEMEDAGRTEAGGQERGQGWRLGGLPILVALLEAPGLPWQHRGGAEELQVLGAPGERNRAAALVLGGVRHGVQPLRALVPSSVQWLGAPQRRLVSSGRKGAQVPWKRDSRCTDPEAGTCLVCGGPVRS